MRAGRRYLEDKLFQPYLCIFVLDCAAFSMRGIPLVHGCFSHSSIFLSTSAKRPFSQLFLSGILIQPESAVQSRKKMKDIQTESGGNETNFRVNTPRLNP